MTLTCGGSFFAEAGAMGLVGGAVEVTLAGRLERLINFGTKHYLDASIFHRADWSVAAVVGSRRNRFFHRRQSDIGAVSGVRAARLDPVQALRYE